MISTKDRKLLLIAGGLLILVVCYSFIFLPKEEVNRELKLENDARTEELTRIRTLDAGKERLQAEIESLTASNAAVKARFTASLKNEDVLLDADAMEKKSGISITSLTIGEKTEITSDDTSKATAAEIAFAADADREAKQQEAASAAGIVSAAAITSGSQKKGARLYYVEVTAGVNGNEEAFRSFLENIRTGTMRSIRTVSVKKNSSKETVKGTVIYDLYAVSAG